MSEPKLTLEQLFRRNKFIPVVILDDITKAVPLAHALLAGGVSVMEVTLRTRSALSIIEKIADEVPEMIVGAGTVLSEDQYHLVVRHKAQFVVSPGLTAGLVQVSRDYDVPFLPGAITPTEVMQAANQGFNYLKFFPAESYNGLSVLKALASPLTNVRFCPTGGISITNAKQYLDLPNVVGVGCSFLAKEELIAKNDFAQITALAKQSIDLINA